MIERGPDLPLTPSKASLPSRINKSTLTVCQSTTEPPTLDPGSFFDAQVYEISQHIFDRLVGMDAAGNVTPALAVSWAFINPQTLELRLRRHIVFHNGEPFNAAAVKFSLERMRSPGNRLREDYFKTVTRVRVVDDHTIQIQTETPDGLLLRRLATILFIFPPRYFRHVGEKAFGRHPVGTGPFYFEHWQPNQQILLRRNANYWEPDLPKLKRLVFRFIPGTDARASSWLEPLLTGELDFVKQFPGTRTFEVQSNASTKLIKTRSARYAVLVPNPFKKPFDDIRMREAMALALDKDLIIRLVANGNGQKVALLSSDMDFGHNSELTPYPYDPERARARLYEAGYADGLTVRGLIVPGTSPRVGHVLAKFLKDIGIKLEYDAPDQKKLAALKISDYDLWIYIMHNPLRHSAFLLNQFLLARASVQSTSACPPGFAGRYRAMVSHLDLAEQARLCRQLEAEAYRTYFVTPLFQLVETYGVTRSLIYKPSVSGLVDLTEAHYQ